MQYRQIRDYLMLRLTFHGGAMSVTGANYLLDLAGTKVLVDCGLAQGSRFAETLNYAPFSYPASTVDVILITHGHADHFTRPPKLFKDGKVISGALRGQ